MLTSLFLAVALQTPPADLAAVGMVLSPEPGRSVALLRSAGQIRLARVGEWAFGGRVVAIAAGRVRLAYDRAEIEAHLPEAAESAPLVTGATGRLEAVTEGAVLLRSDLDRRLPQEVGRILAETALAPVSESGRISGFALTRVPEGTLLTEVGLRAGDVLTSINGIPIESRETLLALWPRLQGESLIRAEVFRDGRPLTLTVTLK